MSTPKFKAPMFDTRGLYEGMDAPLVKNYVVLPVGDRNRVPLQTRVFTAQALYVGDWLIEVFVEDGADLTDRHVLGNIFRALVARAWDDGYTLGVGHQLPFAVNPHKD